MIGNSWIQSSWESNAWATSTWKDFAVNLILNPGFESGAVTWWYVNTGTGTFDVDTSTPQAGSNSGMCTHTIMGGNVQLSQNDIAMAPNTSYRLGFYAKSNRAHNCSVSLFKHGSPYTSYGLLNQVFSITTGWTYFQFDFISNSNATTDARLMLWFPTYGQDGDVDEFDSVSLMVHSEETIGLESVIFLSQPVNHYFPTIISV